MVFNVIIIIGMYLTFFTLSRLMFFMSNAYFELGIDGDSETKSLRRMINTPLVGEIALFLLGCGVIYLAISDFIEWVIKKIEYRVRLIRDKNRNDI